MNPKYYFLFILVIVFAFNLNAQQSVGDLKILAVMVEFQEDRDTRTYGNGKFGTIYTKDYGNDILDPLPHDQAYFSDHLEFVKNYFEKVSYGNLNVSSNVMVDIFTVSQTMSEYSPPDASEDFGELAIFVEEVWSLVDQANPNFDYSGYDMFVIFHAGVSKGLALPGSLGLEKDLPSIYFNHDALKKVFGTDFPGFAMNNGQTFITNTAVLPETDSREIVGFGTTTLVELTINGYMCATVGSHLGVPDLFDTKTGKSAIGRFGLMDPQGFYAYNGVFPPEPSPWVKEFLGWVEPNIIAEGEHNLTLTASRAAVEGEMSLIKVPLNSSEYYLIENRARDANKDGCTITYRVDGETKQMKFDYDQDGFYYHTTDSLKGVIIDVDEFDWAVPGTDENFEEKTFSDAGIVIWHVDGYVVSQGLKENAINADIERRGVFIEEADGIFDIGEDFNNFLTGSVDVREAFKEDSWYKENPARLFTNRFNMESSPATITNTKAQSLISMGDFSDEGVKMTFNLKFGSEVINQVSQADLNFSDDIVWLTQIIENGSVSFYTQSGMGLYRVSFDGTSQLIDNSVLKNKPAIYSSNGVETLIGTSGNSILVYQHSNSGVEIYRFDYTDEFTSSPVIEFAGNDQIDFQVGNINGKSFSLTFRNGSLEEVNESNIFEGTPIYSIALGEAVKVYSSEKNLHSVNGNKLSFDDNILQVVLAQSTDNNYNTIVLTENNKFYIIDDNGGIISNFTLDGSALTHFSVADIKGNGENYIIASGGEQIVITNLTGAVNENFPFKDIQKSEFVEAPLCVDLDNDNYSDIVAFSEDGRILAVSAKSGKLIEGYPISSGAALSASPVLFDLQGRTTLGLINNDSYYSVWNISNGSQKIFWSAENGNSFNTSFVEAASKENLLTNYFPESKAYNWPNPVYDGETYIRYYVAEDSNVEIKIFDLAGELVDELSDSAIGGLDNETVWNVADIQSGVYLARIEVNSKATGMNGSKLIKISVIK